MAYAGAAFETCIVAGILRCPVVVIFRLFVSLPFFSMLFVLVSF